MVHSATKDMRKLLFVFLVTFAAGILPVEALKPGPDMLPARLRDHVAVLASDSLEGRGLGTEGKLLAKNYIASRFESAGLKPFNGNYFQHFDLRIGLARVPGTNVAGYLPGSHPRLKDEYIVIGAHYDHLGYEYRNGRRVIFPGADDNASGVAVLIELAGYFSQNPVLAGRSIIFVAFDAEESGLLGSEIFVGENELLDVENVKVMFSLDMVGMYRENDGIDLLGIGTLNHGTELALEIASAQGIRIRKTTADIALRTDTRPFGDLGIPSVHVFTGADSPYHQPGDTYELLDYEGMARITGYIRELVSRVSQMPELAPSRRFARMLRPYGLRFNTGALAHIGGTSHIYPDEFFSANGIPAFSAGLFLQMHVGRKFAVQPEIQYDLNGSRSPSGTYRRHSVILPVNLQYNLAGDGRGVVRAFSITGGYLRQTFAGNMGGEDLDFDQHPSREWGINLGLGMQVMRVQAAFVWRRGFTDIPVLPETTTFATGSYIMIGYRF
jgi:aminopeptidase YwaD